MSLNKEKNILMMRGMASKVYMKVNLEVGNIGNNVNNYEEFAVMARDLRDHFSTFMKRQLQVKNKTRSQR